MAVLNKLFMLYYFFQGRKKKSAAKVKEADIDRYLARMRLIGRSLSDFQVLKPVYQ